MKYAEAVYPQKLTIGENRGMGSVVNVLAWDADNGKWMTMYSGSADPAIADRHQQTNM